MSIKELSDHGYRLRLMTVSPMGKRGRFRTALLEKDGELFIVWRPSGAAEFTEPVSAQWMVN